MNTTTEPGHGHSPAAWTAVIVMIVTLSAVSYTHLTLPTTPYV